MEMQSLRTLFVDNLKDSINAERQLVKALPQMVRGAHNPALAAAFQEHLEVTERQVTRLEQILIDLGESGRGKKCKGMEGLVEEGKELLEEDPSEVIDAGLIVAAQKMEHYEIAAYGSLRSFADTLGEKDAASVLEDILDEEKEADEKLSELASQMINVEAVRVNA